MNYPLVTGIVLGMLIWMTICLLLSLIKDDDYLYLSLGIYAPIILLFVLIFKKIYLLNISKNYDMYTTFEPAPGKDITVGCIYVHKNIMNRFNFSNVNDPYIRHNCAMVNNRYFVPKTKTISKFNFNKKKNKEPFYKFLKPEFRDVKKVDNIIKNT